MTCWLVEQVGEVFGDSDLSLFGGLIWTHIYRELLCVSTHIACSESRHLSSCYCLEAAPAPGDSFSSKFRGTRHMPSRLLPQAVLIVRHCGIWIRLSSKLTWIELYTLCIQYICVLIHTAQGNAALWVFVTLRMCTTPSPYPSKEVFVTQGTHQPLTHNYLKELGESSCPQMIVKITVSPRAANGANAHAMTS